MERHCLLLLPETPSKDSLRGRRLSSLSRDHVSVEEAGPDNAESKSEKSNERAEFKEKDVSREEEKGEDAPGGTEEVRSDESNGRRSGRDKGNRSEDAQTESQKVEEEEQMTGSDRLSEQGSRSSSPHEAELCQKQESSNAKKKQDSEGSIGSFGDDSFTSDHHAASEALAGSVESGKAQECQEKESGGGKDREGDGETDGAELNKGSDPLESHGARGESGQGGGEVCENGTTRVGPGKNLDQGGRKPSRETKTVTNRPSPSAEVGLGVVRVKNSSIQLYYLRGCLSLS